MVEETDTTTEVLTEVSSEKVVSCAICDDPFRLTNCPDHPTEKIVDYPEAPTPKVVTVKASDRVEPHKKSVWQGFSFKCPECKEPSIMHWTTYGFRFCPSCGSMLKYEWEDKK